MTSKGHKMGLVTKDDHYIMPAEECKHIPLRAINRCTVAMTYQLSRYLAERVETTAEGGPVYYETPLRMLCQRTDEDEEIVSFDYGRFPFHFHPG